MKLTKTSALAALAATYLAQHNQGDIIQARQVAEYLGIPTDSALKILQALARHHLIDSRLGRGGGYRLTRATSDVNLLQIVEAIDGPIEPNVALHSSEAVQPKGRLALENICHQLTQHIRSQLAAVTIAHLLVESQALEAASSAEPAMPTVDHAA